MDWIKIISELESIGQTQAQIAEGIGVSQPHVSNIKNGRKLNFGYKSGKKLVNLHRKLLRKHAAALKPDK